MVLYSLSNSERAQTHSNCPVSGPQVSRLQWCTITSGFIFYTFHNFLSGSMRSPEIITAYNQVFHSICYQSPKTYQWKPAHISSVQHTSSEPSTHHQNPTHHINAQHTSSAPSTHWQRSEHIFRSLNTPTKDSPHKHCCLQHCMFNIALWVVMYFDFFETTKSFQGHKC